jgi:hypothetical protein
LLSRTSKDSASEREDRTTLRRSNPPRSPWYAPVTAIPLCPGEVARQLRALNVQVLIPEPYNPYALGAIDYAHSPYMQNLQSVFDA